MTSAVECDSSVAAPSGRLPRCRRGDAFDDQPQRQRHLECEHWQPHERGDRAAERFCELQEEAHHEQDRRDDAEPGQWDGNHSAAEEEAGEDRAAHGEEGCGESHIPPKKERAERVRCRGVALVEFMLCLNALVALGLDLNSIRNVRLP